VALEVHDRRKGNKCKTFSAVLNCRENRTLYSLAAAGSERAKHVDLRVHFVHEARAASHLLLRKVDSKLNAADILTKASTPSDFYEDLRRRIMGY
jgi:hypothetical protein